MAVHGHRSSDHHYIAASAVLGAFGKFYDSAGAFRCAFLNLASRIHLSELVERAPALGAARSDELRSKSGGFGAYAVGHRPSVFVIPLFVMFLAREPGKHTSGVRSWRT
jgi:hypothetical protein